MRASAFAAIASILGSLAFSPAQADDAKTYGETFSVPVFETVDKNGVDLVKGMLRIASPIIEKGSEEARERAGLQWTGQGWVHIERPTIWRKDGVYTVNALGASEEFKDRSNGFAQKKPLTGSTLSCNINDPGNVATYCIYTNHDGDVIQFYGIYTNSTPYPQNYGQSASAYGNIGMAEAYLSSIDKRFRRWGRATIGGFVEYPYHARTFTLTLGNQSLTITTPNHDGTDVDEHYLRPKGTTQTITDDNGSVWAYTIDSDREMTRIDAPGTAADVVIGYYGNHKVKTVTTADGVWTYTYTSSLGIGTTTVANQAGESTYVKYDIDKGWVTEFRDQLNRWTYYHYDSGDRLDKVTYPEQNYVEFQYDGRGNVERKTVGPKPGMGVPISEYAHFDADCADRILCNRPRYIIAANGGQTDFEYPPTGSATYYSSPSFSQVTQARGTGRPSKITQPAAQLNGVRPEVRNTYSGGILVQSKLCRTTAACQGTSDEVVNNFSYIGNSITIDQDGKAISGPRLLIGREVVSDGVTIRTCIAYDDQGRKVSETPGRGAASSPTCPYDVVTAPAANASVPATPNPVSAPTYPDTSGAPPGSGEPPGDPPSDPPPGGPQP